MKKSMITTGVLTMAVLAGSGFILSPKPKPLEIDVTTRIETIGGHQYAIAISSTLYGYDAKSSITMVHHAGCPSCVKNDEPRPQRAYVFRRPSSPPPPIAMPYPGQF